MELTLQVLELEACNVIFQLESKACENIEVEKNANWMAEETLVTMAGPQNMALQGMCYISQGTAFFF